MPRLIVPSSIAMAMDGLRSAGAFLAPCCPSVKARSVADARLRASGPTGVASNSSTASYFVRDRTQRNCGRVPVPARSIPGSWAQPAGSVLAIRTLVIGSVASLSQEQEWTDSRLPHVEKWSAASGAWR